ncbi:sensor histidine kinase [Ectobacillus panaciterrae]|uniref:sensor histidine kinase n=1 Tax=Ectobacillus panaciterrae TaxID=363872 RepID=UPI00041F028C|nr:sensor histidine kinase [Ectobacillus panaciterrae]
MKHKQYLLDRLGFILMYIAGTGCFLLAVQLDLWMYKKEIHWTTIIYGLGLSSFFFMLFLIYDYRKRNAFTKDLRRYIEAGSVLADSLSIQNAHSYEQELLLEVIASMRQQFMNDLNEQHMKRQNESIFLNQWIHQMKTPVSVIELLLQKVQNNEAIEDILVSIREENDRILQGLDLALHMARLEQFEKDYKIEAVYLQSFLRDVINQNKKTFIQHGVFPKLEAEVGYDRIQTDKKWFAIALSQVIGNALKYTKIAQKEAKHIIFQLKEKDDAIELRVRDNGIGIPKQDLKRVFDPFFTGINGRRTREATGMGLYITKQICDRLHHGLFIEAEQGEGTTVVFRFVKDEAYYEVLRK